MRRWLRHRVVVTIGLVVVASGLAVLAGFLILDRTALDDDGLLTGSGALPEAMPAGFPIPAGSVIGATSVDPDRRYLTVEVTTPGTLVEAVSAHTIGLVSGGYVVDRSEADGAGWVIHFSRLDLRGTIELTAAGESVRAMITVLDPRAG